MDYALEGKNVLVTGGAAGIGRAIAAAFIAEGAAVTISGLSTNEVEATCRWLGGRCQGIGGDLTRPGEAEKLAAFAERRQPVDYLINNVGVFEVRDFFEISDERWFEYFDINVMTAVRMSRALMKPMLERGHGGIVFVSSESAVKPQPWMVHYGAMKACLLGLSRALAELTKGTRELSTPSCPVPPTPMRCGPITRRSPTERASRASRWCPTISTRPSRPRSSGA